VFEERVAEGIRDLRVGSEVIVLTWLDRARRDVLAVHPRGHSRNRLTGVFGHDPRSTEPIRLHRGASNRSMAASARGNLQALDGTPSSTSPLLGPIDER
jgi:tRNA (Thr-GGU) A37 N-methylase